jgi:hypothetical protein
MGTLRIPLPIGQRVQIEREGCKRAHVFCRAPESRKTGTHLNGIGTSREPAPRVTTAPSTKLGIELGTGLGSSIPRPTLAAAQQTPLRSYPFVACNDLILQIPGLAKPDDVARTQFAEETNSHFRMEPASYNRGVSSPECS